MCRARTCWFSVRCCTTSVRAAGETTAPSAPNWPCRWAPAGTVALRHRSALGDRAVSPAAARHRDPRDLQNPKTIAGVVEALIGDPVLLELLDALAEADSLATGPGVWGDWKASLIATWCGAAGW